MKRRASATLIGTFVVAGLALVAVALIAVGGGHVFSRKERAVMHFSGSIYGLQVGAPVVFRGVPVGTVKSINVIYDDATDSFLIPVVAEFEPDAVRGLDGKKKRDDGTFSLASLVQRGLRAQLSMQSLLTGLLYVDLDLHPEKPANVEGRANGAIEIPTTATAIQNLKQQLDGMDFRRLADDLGAIASSARALVAGPQLKQALDDLTQITGNVKKLSVRLAQRVDPLADDAQKTLAGARSAFDRLGGAADGVGKTAKGFDVTADRLGKLLAPESPLVQKVQLSADELAKAATSLRQAVASDGPLLRDADRMLGDVSRSARALRELAQTLEQHPEALLRGRPAEAAPAK